LAASAGRSALFDEREAVRTGVVYAVFNLLHHAGDADFEKLIQITGRNGKELQSLQKRIAFIFGFFEHTAVERHPGNVAIEKILGIFQRNACHVYRIKLSMILRIGLPELIREAQYKTSGRTTGLRGNSAARGEMQAIRRHLDRISVQMPIGESRYLEKARGFYGR
jgi:hypothetical protein